MDIVSELRAAIVKAAMQAVNAAAAQRSWDSHSGVLNPNAPGGVGAGAAPADAAMFATGYDSGTGLTVVPFMFDESELDGGDTLV
jgi:hypothetical protein